MIELLAAGAALAGLFWFLCWAGDNHARYEIVDDDQ